MDFLILVPSNKTSCILEQWEYILKRYEGKNVLIQNKMVLKHVFINLLFVKNVSIFYLFRIKCFSGLASTIPPALDLGCVTSREHIRRTLSTQPTQTQPGESKLQHKVYHGSWSSRQGEGALNRITKERPYRTLKSLHDPWAIGRHDRGDREEATLRI